MGGQATGQAVMPQMLTAAQEEKYLAAWALEELAALRRDLGDTWEFGVTAAELAFRAWRADGTGERLTADDPRQLGGLIAAREEDRAGAAS
ncbi:MAG: hypothetical protein JWM19_774 [Actinomycetia bacterium]|nr:hypothetical protein [Actinomycetes bacterium]